MVRYKLFFYASNRINTESVSCDQIQSVLYHTKDQTYFFLYIHIISVGSNNTSIMHLHRLNIILIESEWHDIVITDQIF